MKAGLAALGEVSEFIRGITFTPNDIEEVASTNTVGVMRTKNVQEQLDLNDVWKINRKFVKNKNQYLEEGDLLVSTANSWNLVGKASWVPLLNYESSFGGFVTVLRGNKKLVDRRYLYYWFVSDRIQELLRSFSNKTTNISNLSLSRAKELTIPLPPLAEQQRIAALLDTADRILKLRESAIAKLDQLAQSVFVDMFGDPFSKSTETIKLGEVAAINMGQSPAGSTYNSEGVGVYLLNGPTEFGEKFPTPLQWTSNPTKMCSEGDVLFCVRGATAGKLNISDGSYCIGRGLAAISSRNLKLVNNEFLYTLLKQYYSYFQNTGVGSTFINISKDDLTNLPIPKVSNDNLIKFKKFEIENSMQKLSMKNQLSDLSKLVSSLQHQSFAVN